jgi:hypothetical protein
VWQHHFKGFEIIQLQGCRSPLVSVQLQNGCFVAATAPFHGFSFAAALVSPLKTHRKGCHLAPAIVHLHRRPHRWEGIKQDQQYEGKPFNGVLSLFSKLLGFGETSNEPSVRVSLRQSYFRCGEDTPGMVGKASENPITSVWTRRIGGTSSCSPVLARAQFVPEGRTRFRMLQIPILYTHFWVPSYL